MHSVIHDPRILVLKWPKRDNVALLFSFYRASVIENSFFQRQISPFYSV